MENKEEFSVILDKSINELNKIISLFGIELKIVNNKIIGHDLETGELAIGKLGSTSIEASIDDFENLHYSDINFLFTNKTYLLCEAILYSDMGLQVSKIHRGTKYGEDNIIDVSCNLPHFDYLDGDHRGYIRFNQMVYKSNTIGIDDSCISTELDAGKNLLEYWSNSPKSFRLRYDRDENSFTNIKKEIISVEDVCQKMSEIENFELINSLIKEIIPDLYYAYSKSETKTI